MRLANVPGYRWSRFYTGYSIQGTMTVMAQNIEQMNDDQTLNQDNETLWCMIHASWQQRARTLMKVKGAQL